MPTHTYRLAIHPQTGDHGYEIGHWKADANQNNPDDFIVVDRCYDQQEAALRANFHSANPPDHLPPEEAGPGGGMAFSKNQLEAMTKDQLITEANERDIELASHATKADIIDAIVKYQRSHKE